MIICRYQINYWIIKDDQWGYQLMMEYLQLLDYRWSLFIDGTWSLVLWDNEWIINDIIFWIIKDEYQNIKIMGLSRGTPSIVMGLSISKMIIHRYQINYWIIKDDQWGYQLMMEYLQLLDYRWSLFIDGNWTLVLRDKKWIVILSLVSSLIKSSIIINNCRYYSLIGVSKMINGIA